ncbi:MAG: hypothetical protein HC780_22120 [Leptolyngbyaceae cyanobacterium CSU_1_3]|nr:hypothetical protein [Leptolyngbyaceae cyanobacterium CSU_1_3]
MRTIQRDRIDPSLPDPSLHFSLHFSLQPQKLYIHPACCEPIQKPAF